MRIAFAVFVFVHAAAHVVGFLTQSFLVGVEDPDTHSFLLFGNYGRGHIVLRLIGILWLVASALFVVAGIAVLRETDNATALLWAAVIVSTLLSIVVVREAPFGLVANVIILAVLVIPALGDRVLPSAAVTALPGDVQSRVSERPASHSG